MKQKIAITLDRDLLSFINRQAQGNRSGQRVLGLVGILEDNYWEQIQEALSIICGFGI